MERIRDAYSQRADRACWTAGSWPLRVGELILTAVALILPVSAAAAPVTYHLDSGSAGWTARTLDGTSEDVLTGPAPIGSLFGNPALISELAPDSFVTFDPTLGPLGTVTEYRLVFDESVVLELDQARTGIANVTVSNSQFASQPGASGELQSFPPTPFAQFTMPSMLAGTLSVLGADGEAIDPVIHADPQSLPFLLVFEGERLRLALAGVGGFRVPGPPGGPGVDVWVSVAVEFFGVVPEPGSAHLIAMGLACLSHRFRRP